MMRRYGKESIPRTDYDLDRWLEATCSDCGRKQGKRGRLHLFAKALDTSVGSRNAELDCLCSKCFKEKFPKRR